MLWIRIRIEVKIWIRIVYRTETNGDLQHCYYVWQKIFNWRCGCIFASNSGIRFLTLRPEYVEIVFPFSESIKINKVRYIRRTIFCLEAYGVEASSFSPLSVTRLLVITTRNLSLPSQIKTKTGIIMIMKLGCFKNCGKFRVPWGYVQRFQGGQISANAVQHPTENFFY